jgi:DHA1 family bicyclomycin/chloramphenicol resistance-like MFS transporter
MLPAFPDIADELSPEAPNRAQLVITSFVLGMGVGTLFTGPLSDAFGRKPVILGGAIVYCIAAALAWAAQSLELMLAARVLQGIGAAGPRVVTLAIVRDLYAGREMAKITSFVMMVFTLFPAFAPLIGQGIIAIADWRGIYLSFVLFSIVSAGWLLLRQAETLDPGLRRPFRPGTLWSGLVEVLTNRRVLLTIAVQAFAFGMLFGNLSTTQQIFDITFDRADSFPAWFAVIALIAGTGSLLNSQIVERLGMRRVVATTLSIMTVWSAVIFIAELSGILKGELSFALYVVWNTTVFFSAGLTLGNLNALAMEPMGHIAGMAASIVGSVATVLAVVLAVPLGLAFDGTPLPVMLGVAVFSAIGWLIIRQMGDLQGPGRY